VNKADIEKTFDQNRRNYTEEWQQLLSFPSISAEPEHEKDCLDCACWLVEHLRAIGFESRLLKTSSKPVVFGERNGKSGKVVVLFYGHYDVQPVDPLEEWSTPPFEPTLKDGRLYARGAQDNKGQLFYALKAMEMLIQNAALDATVKIVLEGEEECGSKGISEAVNDWGDLIAADVLMVTDTATARSGAPAIIMGLRGILHLSVTLSGPHYDLHSGTHGGVAPNPAAEMACLVAGLHDADGKIALKGFYDCVEEPTETERRLTNSVPFDMNSYMTETGVPATAGEKQFNPPERAAFRPSIDVNGIHSGYAGPGIKTIIPARSAAKITARLVPGQDPEFCLKAIIHHFKENTAEGLHCEVTEQGIGGRALRLDPNSPVVARAKRILDHLTGEETTLAWEGASIPIVSGLAFASGAEPLLAGFGMEEDRAHAPNESFSLEQFKLGYMYVALMLTG